MKRSFVRTSAFLVLVVLLLAALPALAFAGVSEYQVQFAPADTSGRGVFIVMVILSPETKLPAKVRVPLPAGATLLWSGEILGGDMADDPSREASITAGADGLVAEFTLEQVRVAQVEAQWKAPTISGNKVRSDLEWVNTTEAGTYTFAVRLPAGATDVKITPAVEGSPNTNAAGETLRTLTPVRLEEGAKFPIAVSYKTGGTIDGGVFGSMSPVLIGAIVLLAIAVGALLVVIVRQGATQGRSKTERPVVPRPGRVSSAVMGKGPDMSSAGGQPDAGVHEDEPDDEAFTWD